MNIRWIGAILVILGCGGIGFSMAMHYRKEEQCLCQLVKAMELFGCELEYRLSPLPYICRSVAETVEGPIGRVFLTLAEELETQVCPDAACCMKAAVKQHPELPSGAGSILLQLGHTLGRFHAGGQLTELSASRRDCMDRLETIRSQRDVRIRNYQTLGLCAGVALAILLI